MLKINIKRYILYLLRWQLSTPILAWCVIVFSKFGTTWSTVIANLIGGAFFYFIDYFIFNSEKLNSIWEIKEEIKCHDCGKISRGYRLVKTKNYNKIKDKNPQFRCESCSKEKTNKLRKNGIYV